MHMFDSPPTTHHTMHKLPNKSQRNKELRYRVSVVLWIVINSNPFSEFTTTLISLDNKRFLILSRHRLFSSPTTHTLDRRYRLTITMIKVIFCCYLFICASLSCDLRHNPPAVEVYFAAVAVAVAAANSNNNK